MKRCQAGCSAVSPAPRWKPSAWERKRCGRVPTKQNESWDGGQCPRTRPCAVPSTGSEATDMPRLAMVAALEREVSRLTKGWSRVEQEYEGRSFVFRERDETVVVCGGIGFEAARRAAEAVIALYRPTLLQ